MKKLKITEKGEKSSKESASRRGRNSKNKGASFERKLAKIFKEAFGVDFVRTPLSGGFARNMDSAEGFRGDIVPADRDVVFLLHVEAKNAKIWSFPQWMTQAETDAPEGKVPIVVAHKHNTTKSYVLINLMDFLDLIPLDKIVKGGVK